MTWHHNICPFYVNWSLSYQDITISVLPNRGQLDVHRFSLTTYEGHSFVLLLPRGTVCLIHSKTLFSYHFVLRTTLRPPSLSLPTHSLH